MFTCTGGLKEVNVTHFHMQISILTHSLLVKNLLNVSICVSAYAGL